MDCRTFYDRVEQKIPVYKEVNSAENVVQPNLSLSIRDIFDRWNRNLPLDTITRNGTFMCEGDVNDVKDSDFDAVDIDNMDPAEIAQDEERISRRFSESAFVSSSKRERSESVDEEKSVSEKGREIISASSDAEIAESNPESNPESNN